MSGRGGCDDGCGKGGYGGGKARQHTARGEIVVFYSHYVILGLFLVLIVH